MSSPSLLFHTIRHLRPIQVASRAYYRLADRLQSRHAIMRHLRRTEVGNCHWRLRTEFLPPEQQGNVAAAIAGGRFRFQDDERWLGGPIDWDSAEAPMLWRYNLHYFDYLWSCEFDAGRELANDWIARHAIGRGRVGWEPYPISLRLQNWCGYFFGRHSERTLADSRFAGDIRESIALQTAWLSRRLEYHLLGNHLMENAAALVIVGSCFDGPDARRWLDLGTRLLRRQLPEQILPDGMHFELSPMYHSRAIHLLLGMMNVVSGEARDWLGGYVTRMLDALDCVCHPDGRIALLNDSAFGVYPSPDDLAKFARRLDVPCKETRANRDTKFALEDAGYYGARTRRGHYIVCDAGKVGPDYIPGHAHGDVFSFELSLFGDRLVVDSGVYDYAKGEMRDYCRSTAAHNTVEIDGQDQCEFWDAFKVARRGRPYEVRFEEDDGGFRLSGGHDGYRRLAGSPTHRREVEWRDEGILVVRDTVESKVAACAVLRIHLHPDCVISEKTDESLVVERAGRRYDFHFSGGKLGVGVFKYCPEFGVRTEGPVIELAGAGAECRMAFCIAPSELAVGRRALAGHRTGRFRPGRTCPRMTSGSFVQTSRGA